MYVIHNTYKYDISWVRAFEVLMLLCKVTFAIIAVMHLVVSTVLNIAFVVAKIKVGTTEKTVFVLSIQFNSIGKGEQTK